MVKILGSLAESTPFKINCMLCLDPNSTDVLEVLVAEVQAHPILWNRSLPDYKRPDKKRIVWNAIAEKTGLDGMFNYCKTIVFLISAINETNLCKKNHSIT